MEVFSPAMASYLRENRRAHRFRPDLSATHTRHRKNFSMRRYTSPLAAAAPTYFESLQARYRAQPQSVDESWQAVFRLLDDLDAAASPSPAATGSARRDVGVALVEALRARGHLLARLDPLADEASAEPLSGPTLAAALTAHLAGSDAGGLDQLSDLYLGGLALETGHIDDAMVRRALVDRFEQRPALPAPDARRAALDLLVRAEIFERFLSVKTPTKKRFGAEGAETVVPLLARIIERAAAGGIRDVVIGTMHRGRLNLMANVLREPAAELLHKFKGGHPFPIDAPCAADVPYHLGFAATLLAAGREVGVTLCPNPSHLEAVNPVALGRTRARQDLAERAGQDPANTLAIILHTDASVIGQGSVSEIIQLGGLDAFTTRGTIHVVINNQIGFTTNPSEARTSRHCTGLWKAVDSAILHVNGNDPDAALAAADIAVDFRRATGRDAVIDLVCYRRNGHNEIDEPRFTQPVLYRRIDVLPPVAALYGARLAAEGVAEPARAETLREAYWQELQDAYAASADHRINRSAFPEDRWSPYRPDASAAEPVTGIAEADLKALLAQLGTAPKGFTIDPKMQRVLNQRLEAAEKGANWAVAESLAFATLLKEGTDVRLVGQDVVRGAFSHRHFTVADMIDGRIANALQLLGGSVGRFDAVNSPLAEHGVLGFEYGYSLERPDALVIWEAQFGDFANCAQVVVDQFITSGEEKWMQPSGLVVLLPHGLEGQGPEHSSARVERLLQMCAKDNIRVANPSTPANYFHLLRRQMLGRQRKPLFVTSPKTLLRLPDAISPLSAFAPGEAFRPVLASKPQGPARRVLISTGKLAYELEAERSRLGADDVAVLRLEQLYPFPADALREQLAGWPGCTVLWVQEEPANMGAWTFVDQALEPVLAGCGLARARLVARPASPSPAGSFHDHHLRDQQELVARAFES
ncbi:2-oxoglutarate dehydrogenase E1 component [Xanthobacter autotrophicus DSM 431]|uniref:2-oxoglutarate dehydrogenase E1 component n=1 Tax=Xanthobacter nonsaccharivorans TaxID=3119912 RepID=UPI0037267246